MGRRGSTVTHGLDTDLPASFFGFWSGLSRLGCWQASGRDHCCDKKLCSSVEFKAAATLPGFARVNKVVSYGVGVQDTASSAS